MFNNLISLRQNIKYSVNFNSHLRRISSSEIATALRPFYFAVHPDLFGRHPEQRSVNEESLKHLSAHLEHCLQRRQINETAPKVLQFYVRDSSGKRDSFRLVKIGVERSYNAKNIIQKILKTCNLSTDFVDNIKNNNEQETTSLGDWDLSKFYETFTSGKHGTRDYDFGSPEYAEFQSEYRKTAKMEEKTLKSWFKDNAEMARERDKELTGLKEEVQKLQEFLGKRLGIEIRYDCGWNYEHFRGCLKTLERLADMHGTDLEMLKGRIVVFAAFTGVSLEGHVMLFTGDVLSNWLDFIKNIPKHDAVLKKVPSYEYALSQVLLNIKIRRRKFMPKQQVVGYAGHINKVTTTLLDYLSTKKYPKSWPTDLSNYEIVIESEAGPLMVSPTGQFITPANIPGFMLIDFITSNLNDATEKAEQYQRNKYVERDLHQRCINELHLKSLTKDDSVTPDKMIKSLQRLLVACCGDTTESSTNIHLNITNYYSVLSDGTICIPWDFTAE